MGNFKPRGPRPPTSNSRPPSGPRPAPHSTGPRPSGPRPAGGRPPYRGNQSRSSNPMSNRSAEGTLKTHEGLVSEQTFAGPSGDNVRVIVMGGLEEVGRNCTLIEYKDDIIIIDLGLQFPDEDMPGVDYIIPNMAYLKGKEKNVRGVVITHGHYDHIGAIPHIIPAIGNPVVYALPIAAGIINKRQTDYPGSKIVVKNITVQSELQLGVFKVHFFHINHNIPDSAGIVVETPAGTICHTGDWKFDYHPVGTPPADLHKIAQVGMNGVMLLMGDSTNAGQPGQQTSEAVIGEELRTILEKAKGRVIVGTFASLLSRVKQLMEISESLGRKIALEGYSMKTNVEIARELGFININPKSIISIENVGDYAPNKVTIICTGAQGEQRAAMSRIANDEHRFIRIERDDTIIFSSSVIPGNENTVQRLKDVLYRKRARVIHKDMMDIHAGGHAKKEDVKLMLSLFKPKYYMPIEGNHFLLRENAEVAYSMGWKEEDVFVADNGQIIEFHKDAATGLGVGAMTTQKVPSDYVFVDGLGVGDISQVVLRDRQALAEDGMVVVITQVEKQTGRLVGEPDIVTRGFIHTKENKELIVEAGATIRKALMDIDPASMADPNGIKDKVREELGKFIFVKTQRRPMILPVVIEV